MEFSFDQIVSIGMLAVAMMTFFFGVMKFFNVQTHSRMTKMKEDLDDRIENIEHNAATRTEMAQSMDAIKEMMRGMRDEQHRMATRLDDLFKWHMEQSKK